MTYQKKFDALSWQFMVSINQISKRLVKHFKKENN